VGDNEYGFQQPPARSSKDILWWKRVYRWTGWRGKTLWDWLVLLLAVIGAAVITSTQMIATTHLAQSTQTMEERRAQDAVVQTYTDQMVDLFATNDYLDEGQEDETRTLARARTLAALQETDPPHTKRIIRFLSDARLIQGDTPPVSLSGADLTGIVLSDVDLSKANLSGANLSGAKGITNEELQQQAASLKGTTMPNGQTYEDWLKEKEGSGEDGENSGP
jgi:hypothetical protein